MKPLGPTSIGKILNDPLGEASRDANRMCRLFLAETEGRRDSGGGGRTDHGGRVEPRLVNRLGRHETHATHQFDPHRNATPDRTPDKAAMLSRSKNRGNDDRAGVNGAALECVVIVFAMR